MPLNWTLEVILGLVSLVPYIIGCTIASRNYRQHREPYALLLLIAWIIINAYVFFGAIAVLTLILELYLLTTWIFVVFGFCIILLVDVISRESISPTKIGVWCVMIGICLIWSFDPTMIQEVVLPNGDRSIFYAEHVQGISGIGQLGIFFLLMFYAAKINRNAPRRMKSASRLFLAGTSIVAITIPGIILLSVEYAIPGGSFLPGGVGTLLVAMAFTKDNNLAYVLPARVLRLTVIDAKSGIRLFSHTWRAGSKMADEDLFSGALQGISMIVKESVGRGRVREIRMDEGIMILHMIEGTSIACILVATNSSRALRIALSRFGEQFAREYGQFFANTSVVSPFESASNLIPQYFPFAE